MITDASNVSSNDAMPQFHDLKGRTVFVTGGGSGIGATFTRAFTLQGAQVGFVSLRQERAELLCDEVEQLADVRPFYIRCDIRDVAALRTAIEKVRAALGPISILVNNAARDTRHKLESMTVDEWDNSLKTLSLIHISEPTRPY